jgi:hypothetical protein
LARSECQLLSESKVFITKVLDYACDISKLLILQTIHHLFFLVVRAETIEVFAQALELARHSSMVLDALESIS